MALTDRSYTAGRFMLDVGGHNVGYLKKFSGMHIEGKVGTHDLGPDNVQKKNITNFKWMPGKASVGIGMGRGMYEWIKASFDKGAYSYHGAVVSGDFNYKAQSRLDFEDALITSVTIPKLEGGSDQPAYFDIEFEAEKVRWAKGGGEDIRSTIGPVQKQWLCSNFLVEIGNLPCTRVASVDTFSWKCSVAPDEIGQQVEYTKHPAKVSVPNLKLDISMADYQPWADFAHSWFIGGQRKEQTHEMNGRIVFLGPDRQEELGEITLEQVGLVKFSKNDHEANSEKIARFNVELYVEKMKFLIHQYDA